MAYVVFPEKVSETTAYFDREYFNRHVIPSLHTQGVLMLSYVKTFMIGSLYIALFFSSYGFNQVSARIADDRPVRASGGIRNNQTDAYRGGGRYNYMQNDGHHRNQSNFGQDRGNDYGGPGYYNGDSSQGYRNSGDHTNADNGSDNDGGDNDNTPHQPASPGCSTTGFTCTSCAGACSSSGISI